MTLMLYTHVETYGLQSILLIALTCESISGRIEYARPSVPPLYKLNTSHTLYDACHTTTGTASTTGP